MMVVVVEYSAEYRLGFGNVYLEVLKEYRFASRFAPFDFIYSWLNKKHISLSLCTLLELIIKAILSNTF